MLEAENAVSVFLRVYCKCKIRLDYDRVDESDSMREGGTIEGGVRQMGSFRRQPKEQCWSRHYECGCVEIDGTWTVLVMENVLLHSSNSQ